MWKRIIFSIQSEFHLIISSPELVSMAEKSLILHDDSLLNILPALLGYWCRIFLNPLPFIPLQHQTVQRNCINIEQYEGIYLSCHSGSRVMILWKICCLVPYSQLLLTVCFFLIPIFLFSLLFVLCPIPSLSENVTISPSNLFFPIVFFHSCNFFLSDPYSYLKV